MKITALLTGRGNNTLKDKNVLDILGHPVLYYPAHAARASKKIDSYYCSSDDEKILSAAEEEGFIRIVRPDSISTPTAQHVDVIKHAVGVIQEKEEIGDILVVILANNVTIKSQWIDECIEMMQRDMTISAVVPVYEDNDHHPLRGKRIDENGRLQMYERGVEGEISTNRQDLPKCYFLSHNIWVLNTKLLLENNYKGQQPWGFMGNNIAYYEIEQSIDIHKEIDLYIAKEWISENYTD
jgi:CMP-N-acetylneuraminic acid synthetase